MSCASCQLSLREPFIHCVECIDSTDICLQCFVTGKQFGRHYNYHGYEVKSLAFSLFEKSWSAREEMNLLDATEELGYGNWAEISRKVRTKTSDECEKHYVKFYVNESSVLPKFTVNREKCLRRPFPLNDGEFRPTPETAAPDDVLFLSGYMAPRADFHVEYDNFAESDVKNVEINVNNDVVVNDNDDEDHELDVKLNLTVVDIYYTRLKERQTRKDVLRDYGLLDVFSMKALACKNGRDERHLRDRFRKFMRLLTPDDYEQTIQSILHQKKLENRIQQLQEFRHVGLRTFRDVSFYKKFKKQRKLLKPKVKLLDEALLYKENPLACQVWLQRQLSRNKVLPDMPLMPPLNRKKALPLDLHGAPGYEQLSPAERDLCSNIRLWPQQYVECRNVLLKESHHSNGVIKLQTARDVLKIDVNKTRRLYNFCLDQGYIKAEA